jgi:hypothetical protein
MLSVFGAVIVDTWKEFGSLGMQFRKGGGGFDMSVQKH